MNARIITIGDEILIGQIVDTNSAWIAEFLNNAGFKIQEIRSIADNAEDITDSVKVAMEKSEITIVTGGLGPTKDDITKITLAKLFGGGMKEDPVVMEMNRKRLEARGIALGDLNCSQAIVPEACVVLPNNNGTAPGMWFEKDDRVLVSLPGVPFEMKELMIGEVMPKLKERFEVENIVHKTMVTIGIAESTLAEKIAGWENDLPEYIKLAYLPGAFGVKLRLSAYGGDAIDREELAGQVEKRFQYLYNIIPENILGYGDVTVQSVVADMLVSGGKTLSIAESCTGGYISTMFTEMPGASEYLKGGAVTYSNETKEKMIGVSAETLEEYGAVSEQVVKQMAEGIRKVTGTDYAVATTGIAGPTGGTEQKPVGTVWIAVASAEGIVARKMIYAKLRKPNIERASSSAVNMLRNVLLGRENLEMTGGIF